MAKTNTIQVFRSTTASAVPGSSALAAGELAVNLTDKKLFVGDAAGTSYIELTRRAAAASAADAFKVQLADTTGYLTGPSGTLYYQPTTDTLWGTSCDFGSVKLYTDGTNRIIEGQGNPSKPLIVTHTSLADICIGDALLQNGNGFGIVVSDLNTVNTVYGDLSCVPDALANTTGFISTQGGIGLLPNGVGAVSADIRFYESTASGGNYVGFKAPSTIAANKIWTLPSADGTSGQVLSTNGSGTLSWTGVASVSGSDTQVIFNDGGSAFGADAGLTYNKTTDTLTIAGDLAVNGGDLTCSATTFNLLNSTVTTLNLGGAATAITIGASTGTTTFANGIVAPVGTATLAPFKMQSGTNLTSATAGAFEYDGKCFYQTTANGRALAPVEHFAIVSSTRTISNVNTAQNVFDAANDVITLAANTTYAFEGFYRVISGTTTAHTTNMSFSEMGIGAGGTWYWLASAHTAIAGTVSRAQDTVVFSSSAGGATNASSTTALVTIWFRGTVETSTDAVSVTPQITFSAAPGGTNQIGAGTFIRFTPLGTDTVQSVGPWS